MPDVDSPIALLALDLWNCLLLGCLAIKALALRYAVACFVYHTCLLPFSY